MLSETQVEDYSTSRYQKLNSDLNFWDLELFWHTRPATLHSLRWGLRRKSNISDFAQTYLIFCAWSWLKKKAPYLGYLSATVWPGNNLNRVLDLVRIRTAAKLTGEGWELLCRVYQLFWHAVRNSGWGLQHIWRYQKLSSDQFLNIWDLELFCHTRPATLHSLRWGLRRKSNLTDFA